MPNVTYLSFNRFPNPSLNEIINSNTTYHPQSDYPDNVFLLIEEQSAGSYQYRSTTSIALMILAWAFMLIGFTLCCCIQFFERSKETDSPSSSTSTGATRPACSNELEQRQQQSGPQATNGRCTRSGDTYDHLDTPSDRTRNSESGDVLRRYDVDLESLPSYTIVSGLPTYDDALEEFRKAGIILSSSPKTVIKIFENDSKENLLNVHETGPGIGYNSNEQTGDTVSLSSTCTCGAASNSGSGGSGVTTNSNNNTTIPVQNLALLSPQIIELSPQQLQLLSQKRLSLQITFNNSIRRNSRPRVDLYREANRNNHLRSKAPVPMGSSVQSTTTDTSPRIHRSSSTISLSNERNIIEQHLRHLQHRGSLS